MPENTENSPSRTKPTLGETIFGGSPVKVVLQLVLVSLAVGFVMTIFGLSPLDLFRSVERFFISIFESGFRVLGDAWVYLATGAMVVIPIWVAMRLLSTRRQ